MILKAGDIVADKYRIERLIGEGGMGTVYAAKNEMTGRAVALKWLRTELSMNMAFTERFTREARLSGRLDHPNIVNVYDVGRHDGTLFLVMELLRGESFDEWVRRTRPSSAEAVGRLMPALRAVDAAHKAGVIHRDLKPEHIFLCTDSEGAIRQTKVLDFGIARELGGSDTDTSLTNPGALIGTVHYMAPEQVRSSRHAEVRSDVYSLGVILYWALGGGLPYEAESITDLIVKVAESRPPPLSRKNPAVKRRLAEVVMRTMAKDPKARYQTVAELGRALEPFSGGVPFLEPQPATSEPPNGPASEIPMSKQSTTMASEMPKRISVLPNTTPKMIAAIIGLPLIVFLLVLGGSWLAKPAHESQQGVTGSGGLEIKAAAQTTTVVAAPTMTPVPSGQAVAPQAPSSAAAEPPPRAASPDPTSVQRAATAPPRHPPSAKGVPAPAAPSAVAKKAFPAAAASVTAPAAAPEEQPKPGSAIEHNPYLRH